MTTAESTMMTPIDRSMPAVRMTSVWRGTENTDDRDLLQDQRQRAGGEEPVALQHAEYDDREDQNDGRNCRRRRMQKMLDASEVANGLSKLATDVSLWSRTFSNS